MLLSLLLPFCFFFLSIVVISTIIFSSEALRRIISSPKPKNLFCDGRACKEAKQKRGWEVWGAKENPCISIHIPVHHVLYVCVFGSGHEMFLYKPWLYFSLSLSLSFWPNNGFWAEYLVCISDLNVSRPPKGQRNVWPFWSISFSYYRKCIGLHLSRMAHHEARGVHTSTYISFLFDSWQTGIFWKYKSRNSRIREVYERCQTEPQRYRDAYAGCSFLFFFPPMWLLVWEKAAFPMLPRCMYWEVPGQWDFFHLGRWCDWMWNYLLVTFLETIFFWHW